MAVAYQSDGGTVFAASASNAAITVPLPATRPVGSVLLLILFSRLITDTVGTAPSGYTLLTGFPKSSTTASGGRIWVYAKEVVGGETAPTVACSSAATGNSGDLWGACIFCYSGVDLSGGLNAMLESAPGTHDATASTSTLIMASPTAIMGSTSMLVYWLARWRDAVDTFTAESGSTEREDAGSTVRTGGQFFLQDRLGSVGFAQCSCSVSGISARYLSVALVLKQATSGPTTHTRTAALTLTGLIATIGRELLARSVVLSATGLVASSGVRVTPASQRSAALAATGLIASAGRELLPRSIAIGATGLVASRGIKIKSRSAALAATATIAAAGRETISRSAALAATAAVASAGREQLARLVELGAAAQISATGQIEGGLVVVSRSASLSATGAVASAGRELLPRTAAVTAAAQIATVGRRRLHRSSAVAATAQITVSGEILGAAARAVSLTATGLVATRPQRTLARSATVTTAPAITTAARATHSRMAALATVAAITTTTGKTGEVSFVAFATVTLSRYLEPGYLTSTRSGRIAVIYHGQIPVTGLGGIDYPGEGEGELAVGTVGGIARTGG